MIVYHGTTEKRAKRICAEGFQPKKPSRRIWFAEAWSYAYGRAKTQAQRTKDLPAVLTCDINVNRLRREFGSKRVFHRNSVIAIKGQLPVSVVRSYVGGSGLPRSPREIATWLNGVLRLSRTHGVTKEHPGVRRLSSWIAHRVVMQPRNKFGEAELLYLARRWAPEIFKGRNVDAGALHAAYRVTTIHVDVEAGLTETRRREAHALELLEADKAKQRAKGLNILKLIEDPDLAEWCALCLDDESVEVRIAALQALLTCEQVDTGLVEPFAEAENRRERAFATAVLAKFAGDGAPCWFERGLKDTSPCVRIETARQLKTLNPVRYANIFELALYDSNRTVSSCARKLIQGKGFHELKW